MLTFKIVKWFVKYNSLEKRPFSLWSPMELKIEQIANKMLTHVNTLLTQNLLTLQIHKDVDHALKNTFTRS